MCPDGQVYHLEVEEDHTYLANGFVVHNCHHPAASGYQAVLDVLADAFVSGVTATPDRLDKQSIERIVNAYLKHRSGRQALCFAVTVAYAEHLAQTLLALGVPASVVSAETPPEEHVTGYSSVWARLAPDFKMQQWLSDASLEWAQMHADMEAKLIESSEKKLVLVDNNAPWRALPVSGKQRYMLRKFNIAYTEKMTSGEAPDLIGREIAKREKEKAENAAKERRRSA